MLSLRPTTPWLTRRNILPSLLPVLVPVVVGLGLLVLAACGVGLYLALAIGYADIFNISRTVSEQTGQPVSVLAIVMLFPGIALWLPDIYFGR